MDNIYRYRNITVYSVILKTFSGWKSQKKIIREKILKIHSENDEKSTYFESVHGYISIAIYNKAKLTNGCTMCTLYTSYTHL